MVVPRKALLMSCNLIIRFHPASLGYLSLEEPAKQATIAQHREACKEAIPSEEGSLPDEVEDPALSEAIPSAFLEDAKCSPRRCRVHLSAWRGAGGYSNLPKIKHFLLKSIYRPIKDDCQRALSAGRKPAAVSVV